MPYLNWKQAAIRKSVSERDRGPAELQLAFPVAEAQALARLLGETFASPEAQLRPELRVDLPDQWILFFKLRDGESRLLLAHPEKDEWVATLALDPQHGSKLVDALSSLQTGSRIDLRALGAVGGISNVNVLIEGL